MGDGNTNGVTSADVWNQCNFEVNALTDRGVFSVFRDGNSGKSATNYNKWRVIGVKNNMSEYWYYRALSNWANRNTFLCSGGYNGNIASDTPTQLEGVFNLKHLSKYLS